MASSPLREAGLGVALALACEARAEAPDPAPAAPPPRTDWIEEIVITAERREMLAQDYGGSVSAFSEEMLDARGIQEIHDLHFQVPSLVATGGPSQITLRGVGNDVVSNGADAAVAFHVDGVYRTPGAALTDYFDVERIEVFPGPQGSLGGRNTTGGSLQVWTNRPAREWRVEGDFELASYEKFRVQAVVNVPLGETLALRVAALYEQPPRPLRGEPASQRFTVNDLDGGAGVRASLRWTPSERITVDLIGSHQDLRHDGATWRYLGDYPAFPAGQSALFSATPTGSPDYTGASPNPKRALRAPVDRRNQDQRATGWYVQSIVEADLGPVIARAIGHYTDGTFLSDFDLDASDLDIERGLIDILTKTSTVELTLRSPDEGRWRWLVGGNWQTERPGRTKLSAWNYQQNAAAQDFVLLELLTTELATRCGASGTEPCAFSALPTDRAWVDVSVRARNDAAGAFASLSFDWSERLRFVGGVRYSFVYRDFRDRSVVHALLESLDVIGDDFCASAIGVPLPATECFDLLLGAPSGGLLTPGNTAFAVDVYGDRNLFTGNTETVLLEKSWEAFTGNLRVELRPREDVLLYASFATGNLAGGFNTLEAWTGHRGFASETNRVYELGAKGTLAGRVQLNLAAYYYDYENKSTGGLVNGLSYTVNAAQSEIFGADLQLVWAVSEALQLRGTLGWLRARYASDFLAADTSLGPDNPTGFLPNEPVGRQHAVVRPAENVRGNPLPRAPDWTLALGADYGRELGEYGRLSARLDFAWRDEVNFRQFANPLDRQSAITRTDVSLRWERADARIWAELFASNLEDRRKIRSNLSNESSHRVWFLGLPRLVGGRIGFRWQRDEP